MDHTYAPRPAPATETPGDAAAPSGRRKLDMLLRMARENGGADRVRPRAPGAAAPLSFGQERLWLLNQLDDGVAAYNVKAAYRLPRVDADAMERALGEVIRRHESLRTTFAEVAGEAAQGVAPFAGFVLPVEDLSALAEDEREAAALRRANEEAVRPYDLAAGPLFRPRLLRLGADDVLLLYMHHIVSDGWSMRVLYRELSALYEAFRDGRGSPLPEPELQYADFAIWQRKHLAGDTLDRHLAYWKQTLAGAPAVLELPTDRPRPATQSYRGARETIEMPVELLEDLKAVGRAEGATLFMVVLAAFQALLGRYAGTRDVLVGSPVSGRGRKEVEGLIGFFVNTLVLRTDLSGDPTFRELVRRVRDVTLGAYEHQDAPFEKLVAELQPERTLSHSPIFQVAFACDSAAPSTGAAPAGLAVRGVRLEGGTSQFDLTLSTFETAQGLRGTADFSTDLFDAATIRQLLVHLERMLRQVATDTDVRLSRVELVSAAERDTLVQAWNRTDRPWPRGVTIPDLFAAQVAARPDAEALAWSGLSLSYAELDARANRLAHHLAALGVGPEARVGVLMERSPELVIAMLAIVKAGGCFVPLDPTYPAERLELMLADAAVRVLVARGEYATMLKADGVRVVSLDDEAERIAAGPAHALESGVSPDNLAYIVYTSGSTGRPKGVMVGHREVVQLVVETDFVHLGPGDRIAQASNSSFDALAFEAWGAWLNGATLVGIPRDVLLSPPALRQALRDERITTLYQTTALLNQLTREQPDIFAPLREVLFGGQACDADALRRLTRDGGKPRRLLHVYGPTETTAWCTFQDVRQVADDAVTVSVGTPIGNARAYVLDRALRPTPVGVPGECYVGGWGVVRGYLDRPALTAERFVPDPFSAQPGARMYRTGDKLRWLADGTLEFVTRLDDQVKIRGFRIEPGEVEAALNGYGDVREARVIVREDVKGEPRLVAYVVGQVEADELRFYLRQSMPEYMVPSAFVVVERLPLTPNGKLDVRALPAPDFASAAARYVAPRTPVEETLAAIWAGVLRVERVGTRDNFFETGGHSLLATRVVSRVRDVFGVELPLRAMFEGPTVAELAERVELLRRDDAALLAPVVPVERTDRIPLSFAQERLWFVDQMEGQSAFYNMFSSLRLTGELDAGALERALAEIVRRHESLRTTFAEVDGAPVQVIAPFAGFPVAREDLSALPGAEREAAVRARASEQAARPFDLAAGPLFRATLIRLGAQEHALLLGMHHVVSDGWSLGVLFRELAALYGAFCEGAESPLAPLPVQYADYVAWQRAQLRGETLERQVAWWTERLAGAPALLELPTDHARPAEKTYRGSREPVELSAGLLGRLQEIARAEGATLYMVVLAAFQVLLGRYAGTDDVVVGSPVAGRARREVEELIGFFVNTLVMRTDLSGNPTFRDVLRRVRENTLGAYEHQEVPFERLVAELQPERSLGHSPLFQVMFSLDAAAPAAGSSLRGLRVGRVEAELATTKFDLMLGLSAHAAGITGAMDYSTDLFERGTIVRMVEHLERVLDQVAADADMRLSALEMVTAAERRVLVDEWNRSGCVYPSTRSVDSLFAEQAAATPGALAVAYGAHALTYAELDARANRLARHLRRHGVGAETRVGVCLERGAEMVVAVLAVLKAGGAYVPLDTAYPAERIALMLADSAVPVLVTEASLRGALPATGAAIVSLDQDAEAIAAEAADALPCVTGPGSLAYVIYTSGSTGVPKGVAVEHRGIVRLVRGTDYVDLGPADRVAQASNTSFDAATFEIWGALLNGGVLVGLGKEVALDAAALAPALDAHSITTLFITTALFNAIAREAPAAFGGLRYLAFGGEAVDPAAVRLVLAAGGPRHLLHVYGPTENTTFSTWHAVTRVAEDAGTVPIGRAVAHSSLRVLDAAGRVVPVGVPGELYTGGDGVARGYLGRPGMTAEKFVPDAFSSVPGARMYRTGDRVRWTSGGAVEFLGRLDGQVKVRGFRIELGEIEAAVRRHPAAADCRVIVREDVQGDRRIVAYVVGGADAAELRTLLRRDLPDYMVPAAFVAVDALPLTPNGKLDRRALPAPDLADQDRYVAPRTPTEEVLAEIWGAVLGVERVGAAESFFELGGHSLLATRVASRVREVFGVQVPLRALFEGPTVAELAERVEEMRRAGAMPLAPVVPVERSRPLPLSFAQERLWFLDRLEPGSTTYNMTFARRLAGALDADALRRALAEIVRRHEALRTVFAEAGGRPVQVVAPFAGFAVAAEDLSALPVEARDAAVRARVEAEGQRPFDLAAGPLVRAALLRVHEQEHVLVLCMHHVVADGWSMGVLFRELAVLYTAFVAGAESPLPELAVQYADFAAWQREQLRGEVLDRQLGWWTQALAGAPALLELPTDHPRPAVQSYRGARIPVQLPAELLQGLQALGRREGATLYMVLLGALQVVMGKYAGTDDVVVGSPIAGRTRRETEPLIGFFVNTLALRTDLSGDPTFREVLARVRRTTLSAYEHQDLPFEKLVAELQPERSLAHTPLFQVMFALQNADGGAAALSGLSVSGVGAETDTAKFDLSLGLAATAAGLRGEVVFSTDLWERATIQRMMGHLERVLAQVAADATVRLSALEMVDAAERSLVVETWNATAVDVPAASIPALFAEQAARTPHAVALVCEDESLTYAELDARANRVARHLRSLGVGPETRVGLCMQRGVEMVVALLGILKAGGAYVPLDPGYPAERLAYMQADSGIAVLLTQDSLRYALPRADGVAVVSMDGDRAAIEAQGADAIDGGAGPDTLAYVIYTSGSTGTPKGAGVAHRSVVRLVRGASFAKLDAEQVVLQAAPVAFDASTLELWGPLLNGGRLVLMPGVNPSLAELGAALTRHGVTTLWLTSGLFQVMVDERLDDLRTVRQLLAGGDVLPVEQVMKVQARFPACQVINGYGPTENTTFTTCYPVPAGWTGGAIPIGAPISNTTVYVVDAALRPVPVGVPGELYTGGEGVARGYLGRPAMTAERFVPDPFGTPGSRMYRTGDRVRWNASGVVEYLGRIDQQVKVRGFRIELGEIETRIRQHADVRECVVVAREDAPGDRRLVAYVIGRADAEALRAHVRETLPDYMTPAAFVSLEALPLNPNGKVDRRALPAPEYAGAEDAFVAPRTPAEEVLAGIWAEVLRVERVGARDSFFALGGHSLLATRVVSRIREVFGAELPLRALFEGPTVAELAERVEQARGAGAAALPPVVPVQRTDGMPLSFAQERLWFLDRMHPEGHVYNMPWARRLSGALDADALGRALAEIVRRHESLRTAFAEVDGRPVQVVAPFAGFTLPAADLSGMEPVAREAEARRRATEDAATPFDLAAGPLFRASLLRLADEEHVLLMNMHHVVSDGWSMGVIFHELGALYGAFCGGAASPLPELAVQYADFAAWQRTQLQGAALDGQIAFWKDALGGAPALLELPTDRPRPAVQSYRGAVERVRMPRPLLARLEALARAEGATSYMVMLAAWQVLLGKYAGTDDVVVGSPIAGRTRRELEPLIGFFVNTLVLRADLSGDPAFREVLRRVRRATLGAYDHQDVPFERLVEELQPERSTSHSPLFQVMFSLRPSDGGAGAGLPGLRMGGVEAELSTTKFDLMLGLETGDAGIHGAMEFSTDLFDRATIRRMIGHLERLLDQVAADADAPLSALELVDAAERYQVVHGWNRTAVDYPREASVGRLFAEQAARTPHAVAVVHEDERLTYAELDARSNRVARHLWSLGVRGEARVGICMERGLEMVAAVLGILKAGAAYVPLDPAYPAERLERMLADSGVGVLLTQDALRGQLPARDGVAVVSMDGDRAAIAARGAEPVDGGAGADSLAYVIYTSGSTGTPKGAGVQHRSIVRLVRGANYVRLDENEVVLQAAPVSFDASTLELWGPLLNGGRLVLMPGIRPSLEEIGATIVRHGVTTVWLTAGLFQVMVDERLDDLAGVRQLLAGGDVLPVEAVIKVQARFPGCQVINGYGPTENTTFTCCYPVPAGWSGGPIPIGAPISSTTVYVLDGALRPVPVGVRGELYTGGDGVARGYLGHPALTAERFVPDPFGGVPGARMYRTGDRVRWNAGGVVEYLGRLDTQVKIRGFRIEPGEVEATLRRHPGVAECAVVTREDVPGDRRLVAYVTGGTAADELRAHLRETLPEYMLPAAFVAMDALPLNPNGKLDRRALPAPEYGGGPALLPPRNALEEKVAEVWSSVLGVPAIGVHDNFFDLGGTSLLLYRVYSRLKELKADLRVVDLFRYTTVEAVAEHLDARAAPENDLLAASRARAEERRALRGARRGR